MDYTIRAIDGELVTIDFANGQWAQVAIPADFNQDQIDRLIGTFCPEYKVQAEANPLLNVGDTHCTCDPNMPMPAEEPQEPPQIDDVFMLDLGQGGTYIDAVAMIYVAQELDANGDSSVLDVLKAKAAAVIADPGFSAAELVSKLNDTL